MDLLSGLVLATIFNNESSDKEEYSQKDLDNNLSFIKDYGDYEDPDAMVDDIIKRAKKLKGGKKIGKRDNGPKDEFVILGDL
jgi:hypothetical protein